MEEPYDPSEYKLTWMLIVTFSILHVYLYIYIYIYQTRIFCYSHEIHFGTIVNSLL
jgi:hypothetical protein